MFWTEDYSELVKPILIPTDYMTIEEKLNTIVRLILFISIICALIFNDSRIILFMIILIILIAIIYNYNKSFKNKTETYLNEKSLDIINNNTCIKPVNDNPFMNPNIVDIKYNPHESDIMACPINHEKINKECDNIFNSKIYRNADDIYDRSSLKRQFYTVPSSTIPNDRKTFTDWLYYRGKSCKENNGIQCYNNLYTPLYYQ